MIKKKLSVESIAIICAGLSVSFSLFADDLPPVCKLNDTTTISSTELRYTPSYFSKAMPNREYAAIILSDGTYLLNLQSGDIHQFPGTWDPVPTPDGLFLTTILNGQSMRWFLVRELIDHPPDDGTENAASFQAENYKEDYKYQSIGIVASQTTLLKKTYRLLTDADNGVVYVRDEHFEFKTANDDEPTYSSGPWTQICTNIEATLKLPIISKDAKMVSFYNVNSQRTEIYRLANDGSCTLKAALPYATGKADFSPDGHKVTFHTTNLTPTDTDEAGWWEHASQTNRMNVYELNLETHRLTRISNHAFGNSYFPTFRADGKIGYMNQTFDEDGAEHFSYVIADPKNGHSTVFPIDEKSCLKHFSEEVAIGALWAETCPALSESMSVDTLSTLPLAISGSNCRKLVRENWQKEKSEILDRVNSAHRSTLYDNETVTAALAELTPEAINGACASAPASTAPHPQHQVEASKDVIQMDAKKTLTVTCGQCHSGDHPANGHSFDFVHPENIPAADRQKMIEHIRLGQMPPPSGLSAPDRVILINYLESL